MFRFVVAFIPALVLAVQAQQPILDTSKTTTTTPSPEATLLGLSASADQALGHGPIDVKFTCADRPLGYYADMANDCKVFHVCNPTSMPDGQNAVIQYSFFCPAATTFDQQALICVPDPAPTACHLSEKYYNGNDVIATTERKTIATSTAGQMTTGPVRTPTTSAKMPLPGLVEVPVQTSQTETVLEGHKTAPTTVVNVPTVPVTTGTVVKVATAPVTTGTVVRVPTASVTTGTVVAPASTFQTPQQVHHFQQPQPSTFGFVASPHQTQHQAQYIKHFPEPVFYPISHPVQGKVFRLG